MGFFTGILVFVVIWWVCFFLVLPFGAHNQSDTGEVVPGSEPGAPHRLNLVNKGLITSGLAIVVWLLVFLLIESGMFAADESQIDPWAKTEQVSD